MYEEVPIWQVRCMGCGAIPKRGEYTWWQSKMDALDAAADDDWLVDGRNPEKMKAYCWDCRTKDTSETLPSAELFGKSKSYRVKCDQCGAELEPDDGHTFGSKESADFEAQDQLWQVLDEEPAQHSTCHYCVRHWHAQCVECHRRVIDVFCERKLGISMPS